MQPETRLIVPPPPLFAALTAAISPACPLTHDTVAPAAAPAGAADATPDTNNMPVAIDTPASLLTFIRLTPKCSPPAVDGER